MFLSILKGMVQVLIVVLKWPLYIILAIITIFVVLCSFHFVVGLAAGKRIRKGSIKKVNRPSIFKRIFIQLPKQIVSDLFDKNPDFFPHQGLIIFEGRQGAGKTIAMVEAMDTMQNECSLAKCITNLDYAREDDALTDWRMLTSYKNDIYGVIVGMDELQNWFSSNDSKNFPPRMLEVITQNRKNRRVILGTTQNFYLLAKAIRSQCTEVRRCTTLFGCLTIVRKFEPVLDSEGSVIKWNKRGMYFFVQNKELREKYDTYKVIERLSAVGFQDVDITEINPNINIINVNKKK